jgi:predicted Zn-dependent peptidase
MKYDNNRLLSYEIEMTYETHKLSNGIRLIHKHDNSPVAYCGMGINTGTRDENEDEHGMAHFVEHMLFKGTKKRKAWHILNRLDSVGGEMNAYTTKEETFIYATILGEDFKKAAELIADVVFNSTFPKNEIEKEREIILDEINSYKDSPSELIFDDFEDLIFAGYPIGKNILGNEESLKKFNTKKIKSFVENNYCTEDMVFFSLGQIPFAKIVKWAEKYFGHIPPSSRKHKRETPNIYIPKKEIIKKDTFQTHYLIGNRAYNIHEKQKRLALYLLNNILGGPSLNSLLNLALRERNALVYNVESNFTPYSDTGVWNVYFGCDPKNYKRCERLVFKELTKLKETAISENSLIKSKKQIMGQIAIAAENKESLVLSLGKSFLHYNKVETIEETKIQLMEISASEIQAVSNEIFDDNKLTTLIYN